MSDVGIISICVSSLIALFIIHMMIKSGSKIKISGKTKLGDFEFGNGGNGEPLRSAEKSAEKSAEICNKNCQEHVSVVIEFINCLLEARGDGVFHIVNYIQKNHVDMADVVGFDRYIERRVEDIIFIYNNHLLQSDNSFIRRQTCDSILRVNLPVFEKYIKKYYRQFYLDVKSADEKSMDLFLAFFQNFCEMEGILRKMLLDSFLDLYEREGNI